jgi:hypothetical protein
MEESAGFFIIPGEPDGPEGLLCTVTWMENTGGTTLYRGWDGEIHHVFYGSQNTKLLGIRYTVPIIDLFDIVGAQVVLHSR